jgi:hypothetical protein
LVEEPDPIHERVFLADQRPREQNEQPKAEHNATLVQHGYGESSQEGKIL